MLIFRKVMTFRSRMGSGRLIGISLYALNIPKYSCLKSPLETYKKTIYQRTKLAWTVIELPR